MPSCCVVTSCSNKYAQSSDVSYHKFPADKEICQKWIEFSDRGAEWRPTRWSSICSRHFERSCFKNYLVKRCLKVEAIPTILDEEPIAPKGLIVNNVNQINMASAAGLLNPPDSEPVQRETIEEVKEDEELIPEYEGPEEEDYDVHEQELQSLEGLEQFVDSLCRLCARTFDQNQLVCYSSFLNLIVKCFPTLNLEFYEYFPRQICFECREKLINFSIFINKTMNAQKYLTERLILNLPSEPCHIENKCIVPSIKQEPIVVIKEEKSDRKTLGLKDKINFKDSKNCEIIKILPAKFPHGAQIDDDIEILNPPLKVEEIIEDDEHRAEHNYVKAHPKIEILEERVFKTEPYFSEVPKFEVCEVCLKKFDSRFALEQHRFDTHLTAVRFCQPCDFGFVSFIDYLSHKLRHRPPQQRRKYCRCGRLLRSGLLKRHMKFCPYRRLKCTKCQTRFKKTLDLIKHTCEKPIFQTFENIEILDEAQFDIVYVTTPQTYNCTQCSRSFTRENLCATHERSHRPQQLWTASCEKCHKVFDRATDLAWHKLECDHPETAVTTAKTTFDCKICGVKLKNAYNLKIHENIHTKGVSFECDKCGKMFVSKQNLTQHQLTHTQERTIRCLKCPKMFKRVGGLRQHFNSVHLNIKDHVCPTCQHPYALKADMVRCRHSALKFQ